MSILRYGFSGWMIALIVGIPSIGLALYFGFFHKTQDDIYSDIGESERLGMNPEWKKRIRSACENTDDDFRKEFCNSVRENDFSSVLVFPTETNVQVTSDERSRKRSSAALDLLKRNANNWVQTNFNTYASRLSIAARIQPKISEMPWPGLKEALKTAKEEGVEAVLHGIARISLLVQRRGILLETTRLRMVGTYTITITIAESGHTAFSWTEMVNMELK